MTVTQILIGAALYFGLAVLVGKALKANRRRQRRHDAVVRRVQ